MKRKEKDALRTLSIEELQVKLRDLRERQFKVEFQHKAVAAANPLEIRTLRRQAARIQTWIRQRELTAPKENS